jgi:hypothetical protein
MDLEGGGRGLNEVQSWLMLITKYPVSRLSFEEDES